MYMAYSNNPNLPRVRMEAVKLVRSGWSTRKVARHLGFTHSAIVKWTHRMPSRLRYLPTQSSRPYHHPKELSVEMAQRILEYRFRSKGRCAFFLRHILKEEGHDISLSSVKRVLRRNGMSRFSRWKKWHRYPPRPKAEAPGILVEIDTIHEWLPYRLYVYTLLDVCSRWAYAMPILRIGADQSACFVRQAQESAPFPFSTIQSDHGSEFSKWFTKKISERNMAHRHSRIRTPNDNAHLERFNRTIQEECLRHIPFSLRSWQREIPEYLKYYNTQRPHMGLNMKTPADIIKTVPSY